MPRTQNAEDSTIVGAMERWQRIAHDEVEDIGYWRDRHTEKRFPKSPNGSNGEPSGFRAYTSMLVAWVARKFPSLKPDPIQLVYEAVHSWHTDWNADRVPTQADLESNLLRAQFLMSTIWAEISSRLIYEPEPPVVRLANDSRDEWLWEMFHKVEDDSLVPYKQIKARFEAECKTHKWSYTPDITTMKRAADAWAKRNEKPPIPKRQFGKKTSAKAN